MGRWLVARADFCSEVCKISMEGNGGGSTSSHAVLWRQLVHSYIASLIYLIYQTGIQTERVK